MNNWLYLILAIILETFGTTCLKLSNGFSVLIPSIITAVCYILCFLFLSYSLRTIDMSIAYAVWCAFGILLISLVGMTFFHETVNTVKIISIILIIIGTVGLRLSN